MRIAILGTGGVATTLGSALAARHDVVFGSRDPGAKTDLPAPAASPADAVDGADLVIVALPGAAVLDAVAALPAGALDGTVVLDVSNGITDERQLAYPNDSIGRMLQAAVPNARVVKSLNTFGAALMVDPTSLPEPTTVFLSGDDADAKAVVRGILTELGWPADWQLDLGGIETAVGVEHWMPMFMRLWGALGSAAFNIRVVHA